MLSKSDETQSAGDWIEADLLPGLRKKYDNVIKLDGELGGLQAFVFEFEDRAPKPPKEKEDGEGKDEAEGKDAGSETRRVAFQDPPDGKKDGEGVEDKGDEKEPFKPLKHRSYILVGVSNAYELRGSFELAEFNQYLPDLDWVAFSFEKILRNRW